MLRVGDPIGDWVVSFAEFSGDIYKVVVTHRECGSSKGAHYQGVSSENIEACNKELLCYLGAIKESL